MIWEAWVRAQGKERTEVEKPQSPLVTNGLASLAAATCSSHADVRMSMSTWQSWCWQRVVCVEVLRRLGDMSRYHMNTRRDDD